MNKIGKLLIGIIGLCFSSLFLSRYNIEYNENKKILTEQAILEYEKDVSEGKDITSKNYVPEDKNYDNVFSSGGRKLSQEIEKSIQKLLKFMIQYLSSLE